LRKLDRSGDRAACVAPALATLVVRCLLLCCLAMTAAPSLQADPLTLDQILTALKSGRPTQPGLVRLVSERHVDFKLTRAVRGRLVAAGAHQRLLRAIEFNPQLDGSAVPSSGDTSAADLSTAPTARHSATAATLSATASTQSAPTQPPTQAAPAATPSGAQDVPTFQGGAVAEMPDGPVTPSEISTALANRDDQSLLAAMVSARGVSFQYTPDLGRAWRESGATAELLAAIATATVTLPPVPDGFVVLESARAKDYNETSPQGVLNLRLMVDDTVEVRLQGDRIVWKSLKGTDGKDMGTERTQHFPMGPLKKLDVVKRDGRGQFVVLQQPTAENNFEMMLRIYDPKGGADRYHLRIEWEHFD
ncbi:MAG: hypothetical protein MUF01_15785, partial [Bryobacterales bacterium]|nr:hypothetical protein [Bryobacterales bacterium]